MSEQPKLAELIEYLKALAQLKAAGHHTTLEINSTMEAIEQELRK
ncbi:MULTISPECIES: hypothetical protein [unclassified Oceanobacillus]